MLISNVNFILSSLSVAAQVFSLVIIFVLLARKNNWANFLNKYSVNAAFVVALVAMLGSLFYSEIAGFEPCKLCWFQRIFMYSQVFMFIVAILRKDDSVVYYSLVLSIIGAIIAGYHYLLQIGAAPAISCSAVGYSVSCSEKFVLQFGYITIPMMAFSAFALIALLMISKIRSIRKEKVL